MDIQGMVATDNIVMDVMILCSAFFMVVVLLSEDADQQINSGNELTESNHT